MLNKNSISAKVNFLVQNVTKSKRNIVPQNKKGHRLQLQKIDTRLS